MPGDRLSRPFSDEDIISAQGDCALCDGERQAYLRLEVDRNPGHIFLTRKDLMRLNTILAQQEEEEVKHVIGKALFPPRSVEEAADQEDARQFAAALKQEVDARIDKFIEQAHRESSERKTMGFDPAKESNDSRPPRDLVVGIVHNLLNHFTVIHKTVPNNLIDMAVNFASQINQKAR